MKTFSLPTDFIWSRTRPGEPMQPDKITALAESFEAIGQRVPISVRKNWDKTRNLQFEIIAGRHRHGAALQLGWDKIECVIESGSDQDADLWQISENLHRTQMSPRAAALATEKWRKLRAQVGTKSPHGKTKLGSVRDTAKALGVDPKTVRKRQQIADMVPRAAEILEGVGAAESTFLDVAARPKGEQVEAAERVVCLKQAAQGFAQRNAERKARRVLPNQDKAAQKIAIAVSEFVPLILKHATELAAIAEHLTPISRQRLARACADHAAKWQAIVNKVADIPTTNPLTSDVQETPDDPHSISFDDFKEQCRQQHEQWNKRK
jgi:ParB-like chromosome segregation protein Spo0J